MLLNVLDFPSAAEAFNQAQDGDRIYFPGISPYVAPLGGWKITKSLDVFGDGVGEPTSGTILRAFDKDSPVLEVTTPARNVRIREMRLQRGGTGSGSGVGILCKSTSGNPTTALGLRFEGLHLKDFPSHGIHLEGFSSAARISGVGLMELDVVGCGGAGVFLKNAYDVQLTDSTIAQSQLNGLSATGGSIAVRACTFDGNVLASTFPPGTDPQLQGNLTATACEMADVDACRFLNLQNGNIRKGCVLVDTCGQVGNCQFDSENATQECRGIELVGALGGPVVLLGNRYRNVTKLIVLGTGVVGCAFYPQFDDSVYGTIVIPDLNGGAYGAAHIVRGVNQEFVLRGLQVPVLNGDPNTSEPVEGMLAFNTQIGLRVYTSGAWKTVSTVAAPPE